MVSVSLHTILLIKKYNETAHEIKPQKSGFFLKKTTYCNSCIVVLVPKMRTLGEEF